MPLLLILLASRCSSSAINLPRGLLDVTLPPFSADSTGTKDATAPLRAAISAALIANEVVWLPPGRYLVSDTLNIVQPCDTYKQRGDGGINIVNCRFRPNVLLGSAAALPSRPTIVLAPHAAGFGNTSSPKNVIKLTNSVAENVNMNQVFRGIDIEIGAGNEGAIGLSACGAQGLSIHDVSVDMRQGGFAAFAGGNGAGGSHVNIAARGGQYGVYFNESQGASLVLGATFSGQTVSAILFSGETPSWASSIRVPRAISRRSCSRST